MLRSGRPGPVILAIPNATATYDETADPYRPVKGWKSAPDPADVRAAIDQLLGARSPLIYAGEGVIYAGAADDPTGPDTGQMHVIRGGSWSSGPADCRAASRWGVNPMGRNSFRGFRVMVPEVHGGSASDGKER